MVPQIDRQGRGQRQAQGQDRRAEGQHHAGGRADDERIVDAGRLRARFRRHHRHAHAGCRRRDRRQGALRILLHVRRQPYRRGGPGAQSAQDGLFGRRLVVGQRRRRRARRSRHGDRRRPGRLDPHAVVVLRHLRHEADLGARSLYGDHADRGLRRPHRADDGDGRRQRAAARSARRRRRLRPAHQGAEGRGIHQGARRRRQGHEDRRAEGGL